jgi:hypothetical protein
LSDIGTFVVVFHGIVSVRRRDASLNGADFAQDVKTAVT